MVYTTLRNKIVLSDRKVGYRKDTEQLREEYKNAIALLRKGYSVRAVAKLEGVSPTTIQKLKSEFIK